MSKQVFFYTRPRQMITFRIGVSSPGLCGHLDPKTDGELRCWPLKIWVVPLRNERLWVIMVYMIRELASTTTTTLFIWAHFGYKCSSWGKKVDSFWERGAGFLHWDGSGTFPQDPKLPNKKRQVSLALLLNKNQVGHKKKVQVPKMEVLTYKSCMDTAYVRENPPPK